MESMNHFGRNWLLERVFRLHIILRDCITPLLCHRGDLLSNLIFDIESELKVFISFTQSVNTCVLMHRSQYMFYINISVAVLFLVAQLSTYYHYKVD